MPNKAKSINDKILHAYLHCRYKSYLLLQGEVGCKTDYEKLQDRLDREFGERAKAVLQSSHREDDILRVLTGTLTELKLGKTIIADTVIEVEDLQCRFDVLERCEGKSSLGAFHYRPVLLSRSQKVTRLHKLLLTFGGVVLNRLQGTQPIHGRVIYGSQCSSSKVRLQTHLSSVNEAIADLTTLITSPNTISPLLNNHCTVCEFGRLCEEKAKDEDNLSLLRGMSEKEILRHNKKGIFTVHQLSHTFRPRRTPKRAKNTGTLHYFALQALALREETLYIHGKPDIPAAETCVYVDIEGMPDRELHYLIGALVVNDGDADHSFFWADSAEDQSTAFSDFLEHIGQLRNPKLFHYGNYDRTALKRLKRLVPEALHACVEDLLDTSVNVLSIVHSHIYFPTYSNSLKDISRFLGFKWSVQDASGLDSMVWRELWRETRDPALKARLIQYNKEDCLALKRLCDFIREIADHEMPDQATNNSCARIAHTDELRYETTKRPTFSAKRFSVEDLEYVNKCAYFDYQRDKVYLRTDPHIRRIVRKEARKKVKQRPYKPTTRVEITSESCPQCGSGCIRQEHPLTRNVVDLKFTANGVRKYQPLYSSWRYRCLKCKITFAPEKWRDDQYMYGVGLMSWCIYQSLVGGQIMTQVGRTLSDVFGIQISHKQLYDFRSRLAGHYESTYNRLLYSLIDGPILHVDETRVNLVGEKGYVWVMASMDKVVFFYRETREGGFLKDMLQGFSGVLISDFYSAYDSIKCPQQKCLVHVLRDIDDDLLRKPLDDELRWLAKGLGELLRPIIETVDRYGLKKCHLRRHKGRVEEFLHSVSSQTFSSELVQRWQKRFRKSGSRMFTFLDYDGVPWNNNNGEHAVKRFAKYRRNTNGKFTRKSLNELLAVLSVIVTCEFNGISVLEFLLSGERDLPGLDLVEERKQGLIEGPQAARSPGGFSAGLPTVRGLGPRVQEPEGVPTEVDLIQDLKVVRVETREHTWIWNELIVGEDQPGFRPYLRRALRYLIHSKHGWLGAVGFRTGVLDVPDRDQWIGWDATTRRAHRDKLAEMTEFVIRSSVRCQDLALRVLIMCLRVIPDDFERRYGQKPWLVESSVDLGRFPGRIYSAANWVLVGQTRRKIRQDRNQQAAKSVRDIYVYPFVPDFRVRMGLSCDVNGALSPPKDLGGAACVEKEFGAAPLGNRRQKTEKTWARP